MNDSFCRGGTLLACIGIVLLGVWEIGLYEKRFPARNSYDGILWDGSKLVMRGDMSQAPLRLGRDLPAHLRPFFFQPIPINEAGMDLLMTVPGIGPATAARILQLREERGAITCGADLLSIHGIGPWKKAKLETHFSF